MSLVSTYVKMSDDKWYENPTIYGKSGQWFICFDDDEPPEIVIHQPKQLSKVERREKVRLLLFLSGVKADIKSHHDSGSRCFPPDWKIFKPAINAFIEILKSPDVGEFKMKYDNVYDKQPEIQGVFYAWDRREGSSEH